MACGSFGLCRSGVAYGWERLERVALLEVAVRSQLEQPLSIVPTYGTTVPANPAASIVTSPPLDGLDSTRRGSTELCACLDARLVWRSGIGLAANSATRPTFARTRLDLFVPAVLANPVSSATSKQRPAAAGRPKTGGPTRSGWRDSNPRPLRPEDHGPRLRCCLQPHDARDRLLAPARPLRRVAADTPRLTASRLQSCLQTRPNGCSTERDSRVVCNDQGHGSAETHVGQAAGHRRNARAVRPPAGC